MNHLYFGDCLDVLKELYTEYHDPFIDLIYIDPPFNSKRNYNVLFESIDMKDANAQMQAFADTVSKEMLKETKAVGHIRLCTMDTGMDKIQILTIDDLLNDKKPNLPNTSSTFKKAQRKEIKGSSYGLFD